MIPELRWLQPEWIDETVKIEWSSDERFWNKDQFKSLLSNPDNKKYVVPLVCRIDNKVVGYNVYRLGKTSYNILNLVVDPEYRNQGLGTLLVMNLITKLDTSEKKQIKIRVRDTNERACLFLEDLDFKFNGIVNNCFKVYDKLGSNGMKQDAYEYVYQPCLIALA